MLQSHTMNKSGQSLTPNYGKSFNNLTWMQPEHAQLRTGMRYLILEDPTSGSKRPRTPV